MKKKQIETKITFPPIIQISFIKLKNDTFIVFDCKDLNKRYLKVPYFIDSIQFTKDTNSFLMCSSQSFKPEIERYASLFSNYLKSFERPFRQKLILKGLGFKANLTLDQKNLKLKLGFSHLLDLSIPEGISIKIDKQLINIEGFDKIAVGNFASKIRKLRLPDSYKGKGVWYKNEMRRLKELKKK